MPSDSKRQSDKLKIKLYEIIFEAETPAGKWFDIILLITIALSVLVVILESVDSINSRFGYYLDLLEWFFTILFSIEYLLRMYAVRSPIHYATSFFGIIDLVSVLPTYLSLFIVNSQYFLVIRAFRLLRIFRIFKLGHFLREGNVIIKSMKASQPKITVFLTFVLLMVLIIGSLMYVVEGGSNPEFSSIPQGIYWAVVTLTTVGYGDITPITNLGKFLSAVVMILGYAVIAVPTGIVSAQFIEAELSSRVSSESCRNCSREGHDIDAEYCKFCGYKLKE